LEELAKVAHGLGEVVGLGLRQPAQCPVELNLMPKSILKRQELKQKRPYFAAAVFSLVLVVFIMGWFFGRLAQAKQEAIENRRPAVESLKSKRDQLKAALDSKKRTQEIVDQYTEWMQARFTWTDLVGELRTAAEATEAGTRRPGMRTGVWIEKMAADNVDAPEETASEETENRPRYLDPRMIRRYFGLPPGWKLVQEPGAEQGLSAEPEQAGATSKAPTNEVSVITLTCRGVSWNRLYPTADAELCYALVDHLTSSPMFLSGTNGTQLLPEYEADESTGTFRFSVKCKLAKPIRL